MTQAVDTVTKHVASDQRQAEGLAQGRPGPCLQHLLEAKLVEGVCEASPFLDQHLQLCVPHLSFMVPRTPICRPQLPIGVVVYY